MLPHRTNLAVLAFLSHCAHALFEPHALDLSTPENPAAILPEHRNYGLFDRPAPIPIDLNLDNGQQHDVGKQRRAESVASGAITAAVPATAAPETNAMTAPATTATEAGGYEGVPTDISYATDAGPGGLTDTYALPSAYDSAQLSSLFGVDSSNINEASTELSAFPTDAASGVEVACTGVPDISGQEVTVCGPTGNPRATGTAKNGAEGKYVEWGFPGLGVVGGAVAFFL